MKIPNQIAALVIIIVLGLVGYRIFQAHQANKWDDAPETLLQRDIRQRKQAEQAFASAITNDVVGWHRTIDSHALIGSGPISDWWAEATVEFVNKIGGIERTTIRWGFKPGFDKSVYAYPLTSEQFAEKLTR